MRTLIDLDSVERFLAHAADVCEAQAALEMRTSGRFAEAARYTTRAEVLRRLGPLLRRMVLTRPEVLGAELWAEMEDAET